MKTFVRQATAPLGVLAFWCGLLMAAWRYPSEYDWRYMTLSSLVSPRSDPSGHLWASGGIVLCGLCGLCWAAVLVWNWRQEGVGERPSGIWSLRLGSFSMACAAVLPDWLLPVPKGHEILALLAFVGLCLGLVQLTFQAVEQSFLRQAGGSLRHPRLYAALLAGGAVFPILLTGCAEAYVFYVLPDLHWVSLAWRARKVPVYLSFAFWEWVTSAVLSVYMVALSLATPVRSHAEGWR